MKPNRTVDVRRQKDSPPELPALSVVPIVGRARGQLAGPLDGRYGSMNPVDMQCAVEWLARQADLTEVGYVVGVPEGGSIPAYAFAVAAGLPVVLASIWQPTGPGVVSFLEVHDPPPFTGKHIYGLSAGDHVIIVDDEVTSGRTVTSCIRALRAAGIRCNQVATLYAADDPAIRARLAAEDIELHAASLFPLLTGEALY